MRKRFSSARQAARLLGYRSGLEEKIANILVERSADFSYESEKISYVIPASDHKYSPDFRIVRPNGSILFIETKGIFNADDRKKHLLIKQQHPELDIRILFQNANTKISKGSKTTYGEWCDKHGFIYASKDIPANWLVE